LRECFISSKVYIDKDIESIFSGLGGFDIDVLKNHYASIARSHWKRYCSLEFRKEKSKKYLYVIRSILCWRLLNRDIYPPIDINDLVNHDFINLGDSVEDAIGSLIDFHVDKGVLSERAVFILNSFILDSLSVMKTAKAKSFKHIEDYDERFRELILVCR
jgi:predicted nucleotidyltransferase